MKRVAEDLCFLLVGIAIAVAAFAFKASEDKRRENRVRIDGYGVDVRWSK